MPKGRKRRISDRFTDLNGPIADMRSECICLLDGLCICRVSRGQDTESVSADDVLAELESAIDRQGRVQDTPSTPMEKRSL